MTKIAIVILNWNGKKDTLDCLESVVGLKTDSLELKVLVVDNASSDGSLGVIKQNKFGIKQLEVIENSQNLGFSGGNNVGIRVAMKQGADFVLVLNNDTLVHKNLLFELLKTAKLEPTAGVFAPKIYFAKGFEFHKVRYKYQDLGTVIWAAGGVVDWANVYGTNRGVDEVDEGQFDAGGEVDFASGAAFFVRVKALKEIGLFDEKLFLYMEDLDLCERMRRGGWRVVYVPKAVCWHKVSQSSRIGSDLNDYFISRNRMVLGMRYGNLRTRIALARESVRLLLTGRKWQKVGIADAYKGNYGKGSWQ